VPHGKLTGGNMSYPEQIDLLLEGKKLYGTPYPEWCGHYCQLDSNDELIWNETGFNGRLLGEHYTIEVIE
jgi:hypothetical protein